MFHGLIWVTCAWFSAFWQYNGFALHVWLYCDKENIHVKCFNSKSQLIFNVAGLQLIQVHQEPEDLVLSVGSSLEILCSITGTTNPYLYWYHWNETAGFTLVFTSLGAGLVNPTSYGPFKSKRSKDLQIVLESDGVSETGSTVWYCAARPHSIQESSHSCTKTTACH